MQFIFSRQSAPLAIMLVLIAALYSAIAADSMSSTIIYEGGNCSGTPLVVSVVGSADCEAVECVFFISNSVVYSSATTCEDADLEAYVANEFTGSSYLLVETFTENCKLFLSANAYLASGECQVYDDSSDNSVVAALHDDGTASLAIYNSSSCTGAPVRGYAPNNETLSSHSCFKNYNVFYSSIDPGTSSSSTGSFDATSTQLRVTDSSSSVGSGHDMVGSPTCGSEIHGGGSEAGTNATVSITPSESSGGINTGAIVGILVAYVLLMMAACILCMDRMERLGRRLRLRR
ncbi:TKL protein kinase [Phytophthora cinnamomi]|uniref:TKL protein kinase n=1 Tax=Phytophthora cinnamomi TaxID=4785 RepID=UPI0035596534|nr:TKL protein kinase [Phytophthora cinnamomi]